MVKKFAEAESLYEGLEKNAVEKKVLFESPDMDEEAMIRSLECTNKDYEFIMEDGLKINFTDTYSFGNRDAIFEFSKKDFLKLGEKDPEEYLKRNGVYLCDVYTDDETCWSFSKFLENNGKYYVCYEIEYGDM